MNNYTYNAKNGAICFERINKAKARREFERGAVIALSACNIRPDGVIRAAEIYKPIEASDPDRKNFDKRVNVFEWYNCANSETGRYAAFYRPRLIIPDFYDSPDVTINGARGVMFYLCDKPTPEYREIVEHYFACYGVEFLGIGSTYAPELKRYGLFIPYGTPASYC